MNRFFLVGCSRSGTTLLQSMIACHPRIVSFPETHFFTKTIPINPILRNLKWYGKKDRDVIRKFLCKYRFHNLRPFRNTPYRKKVNLYDWCKKLLTILDMMARQDRKSTAWLEKTPRHLYYIDSLNQVNSDLKFIHMLRSGEDVVASMHLASKSNADEWGGERSINKCIRWWQDSIKMSRKYKDDSHHFFVIYEQLLSDPENVLKTLCEFISVEYVPEMATNFHQKAPELIASDERWKSRNTKNTLKKSNKLHNNFDQSTINYIMQKTAPVDLDQFCSY